MPYKKWNIIFCFFIALPLILLFLLNLIIDPFDIFHSNFFKQPYQINQRFNKIAHLKNIHSYDGYLLGSSRIGTTDTALLEQYLPSTKFYNMAVPGGTQYDNLLFLEFFLKNSFKIKYLYLQIDITDLDGFSPLATNYSAKHHPNVIGESVPKYFLSYLTILPIKNLIGKIKQNLLSATKTTMVFDIQNTGRFYFDSLDKKIASNHSLYIQNESSFLISNKRAGKSNYLTSNVEAIRKIKWLCEKNNIKLIVFTTPHHHVMMDSFNLHAYLSYLKQIASITSFWDFTGYNSVTLDDHHFYESSHYLPTVSQMIAARIFKDETIAKPKDFGQFITRDNVDTIMLARLAQIKTHDAALALKTVRATQNPA